MSAVPLTVVGRDADESFALKHLRTSPVPKQQGLLAASSLAQSRCSL